MKKFEFLIALGMLLIGSCAKDIADNGDELTGSAGIQISPNKTFQIFSYNGFRPQFFRAATAEDSIRGVASGGLTLLPSNTNNAYPIDAMVNLGRVLFYDKRLSLNGQVSCGSCHVQRKAFTDGLAFSPGFNNHLTERSTMSIQNMDFINNYQWESAVKGLPDLVIKPLLHSVEMGNNSIDEVVERLKAFDYYQPLYAQAFGNGEIQTKSMIWALSQFVGSIYSSSSKYDMNRDEFTAEEKLGMSLFNGKAKCGECHAAPTFAAPDFSGGSYGSTQDATTQSLVDRRGLANNGLNFSRVDGESHISKIPTLRNIEYTAPYMHDGKFKTLDEVIENYDHNIKYDPTLDEKFIDRSGTVLRAKKLNLTSDEKHALKIFLLTLSDPGLITAKRYADPFE